MALHTHFRRPHWMWTSIFLCVTDVGVLGVGVNESPLANKLMSSFRRGCVLKSWTVTAVCSWLQCLSLKNASFPAMAVRDVSSASDVGGFFLWYGVLVLFALLLGNFFCIFFYPGGWWVVGFALFLFEQVEVVVVLATVQLGGAVGCELGLGCCWYILACSRGSMSCLIFVRLTKCSYMYILWFLEAILFSYIELCLKPTVLLLT